jgi:hypothetical protein
MAFFSSSKGFLPATKRAAIFHNIATMNAILAANPIGQRRQSYGINLKQE